MVRFIFILIGILILPQVSSAQSLKFRAREHFEWLSLKYNDEQEASGYFGISNTLNIWLEKPFEYAVGLSFSPILGSAQHRSGPLPSNTDKKIRHWVIGIEAKRWFFQQDGGPFGRVGLSFNLIATKGTRGALAGFGGYYGAGWEFLAGRVGIAPEVAFRNVHLEAGNRLLAFVTSIGFHFYAL